MFNGLSCIPDITYYDAMRDGLIIKLVVGIRSYMCVIYLMFEYTL